MMFKLFSVAGSSNFNLVRVLESNWRFAVTDFVLLSKSSTELTVQMRLSQLALYRPAGTVIRFTFTENSIVSGG